MSTTELEVKREEKNNQGEFYIEVNGERAGYLKFIVFGTGRLILQHTEVTRELSGTGAGRKLLDTAVDYARANNMKIIAMCPYANSILNKYHDQYKDIMA